ARFIRKGKQIISFFKQELFETTLLYKQVICLHAIAKGYTDSVEPMILPFFFRLMFDLELASNYMRAELFSFLKNRKQLEVLCQNMAFDLIEEEVDGWLSDYMVAYNENYGKRAMHALQHREL
ncbi:MAG: hypothetical protein KJZ55_07735, partial [Flavobacteriales bacterium]|nr:hypothetical protein [Flavobacteriales bacterium]